MERIAYGSDPLQFGDLRLPRDAGLHPVVIVIHGGFWRARYDLEYIGHLCAALTAAGIATWSLEYRRIGNPGGGWPGTLQDVARGADHLRLMAVTHRLDLARVIALGHSAGGHLALWLGSRRKIPPDNPLHTHDPLHLAGIVSLAGVADLKRAWELRLSNTVVADFLGGSPEEAPDRYHVASPIEQLPFDIPQKLLHGTADMDVPFELSERYVSAATARGDAADLITLDDAGHFELVDPRTKEFARGREAVQELLL
ncbi:MAG TPA: alpha/beta hydrolase [Terriglobia bacterium]|nr:alpha/beta hydrolase [Terriglobia bacterium]